MGRTSLLVVGEGKAYQFFLGSLGQVRVTRLNPTTGTIRGQFDLTLLDEKGKLARSPTAFEGIASRIPEQDKKLFQKPARVNLSTIEVS